VVIASDTLRFRNQTEIAESLSRAGFTVERVYGDWHRGPMTPFSRTMVFAARRSDLP
jgi:hypothetical protein